MGTKSKNICDDALEKEYKLTDLKKQPRKIEATHAAYEINNVSSLTHGIHQLDVDVNAVQGGKYSKRNQRRLMRQPPQSHTPYQPLHGSHHHHIKIIHHTNHHLTEHAWDAETSTANGMLNARSKGQPVGEFTSNTSWGKRSGSFSTTTHWKEKQKTFYAVRLLNVLASSKYMLSLQT